MVKNLILVHQGIVISLFLYIDFQEEMFLKEMCNQNHNKNFRSNCSQVGKKQLKSDILVSMDFVTLAQSKTQKYT